MGDLEAIDASYSYHFFRHNNTSSGTFSNCLRSLAYQMAIKDIQIRNYLLAMQDEGVRLDMENDVSLWRKIFLNGIFELNLQHTHYWVLDAWDECNSQVNVISMLEKSNKAFPLRILITSRPNADSSRRQAQLSDLVLIDEMTFDDTRHDIGLYVANGMAKTVWQNTESCEKITESILAKSQGSFLWVVLVMEQIQDAFSVSDAQNILDELPQGMDALFERIVLLMSRVKRGKHIVQAIVRWVTCAMRSLTLAELEYALKLDIGEDVVGLKSFITSTCGQLVQVDGNGKVSLVHDTAKVFLLQLEPGSDFSIDSYETHNNISNACLKYLNGQEMKPPRNRKLMRAYRVNTAKRSAFVAYASVNFSQHIRRSHSDDAQLFARLSSFLQGNICSWIEYMARKGNLHNLVRTAKDLRGFLEARAKYYSPIGDDMHRVGSWESDLIRLASQYGSHLTRSPSAIFWLLPPFCPPMTAVGRQYGSFPHGMSVKGLSATTWSDRASCNNFIDKQTRAIACADKLCAVSLSDKTTTLLSRPTYEEIRQIRTPQPTKVMAFSDSEKLLAMSSVHYVSVFSTHSGVMLWQTRTPQECLRLLFVDHGEALWVVTKAGTLFTLSTSDGSKLSAVALETPPDPDDRSDFGRTFICAALSPQLNMVAIAQRGKPVELYDTENGVFLGQLERSTDIDPIKEGFALLWIHDFTFHPGQDASLMVVLYYDGNLVLFDPCELAVIASVDADAQSLACSPDGHTLVTGGPSGILKVFKFESLDLIYKIVSSDHSIRSLAFSRDSLQFLDIRGGQCNVW